MLPFMRKCSYKSDSDLYMLLRPKNSTNSLSRAAFPQPKDPAGPSAGFKEAGPPSEGSTVRIEDSTLPSCNKIMLLYQVNTTTDNLQLCIPPALAPDILQIAHKEDYPGFSRCYKIVTRSWYIHGLTKLLREFIQHCLQCLHFRPDAIASIDPCSLLSPYQCLFSR